MRLPQFWTISLVLIGFVCHSGGPVSFVAAAESPPLDPRFQTTFTAIDQDQDGRLTEQEFAAKRPPADYAKRDFQLFDLDGDGALVLAEFAAVPDAVPGVERGPLPDPVTKYVDETIKAIDKSLNQWDQSPDLEIPFPQFMAICQQLFAKRQLNFDFSRLDSNLDQLINREEARRFVEMQFGIRNGEGVLLHRPNGILINYALFLHIDENRNGRLERDEFIHRSYAPGQADVEFDAANGDGDENLTVEEYLRVGGRCLIDPVLEFRRMDSNLDAAVDADELAAGMVDWQKSLTPYMFPGFDLDRDGQLSLPEFRLTPSANMVIHWAGSMEDTDGDGMLSFAEFQFPAQGYLPFDATEFPLLRLLTFQRLDQNSDGKLDPREYFYKRRTPDEFFSLNVDGTGWKSVFLFEGHFACGSVAISPDGKSMAFDSWPGAQQSGSAIYVMELNGGQPRELCLGMMPTWSDDGDFLCCSRSDQIPTGVWILDVKDRSSEFLCPGWGAQWSPDGKRIACYGGTDIKQFNLVTDAEEVLLKQGDHPYIQVYWNMGWSPDSQRLCFKGQKQDGTFEIASINTTGDARDLRVHYSSMTDFNADFAWHPKGDRIVFAQHCPERGHVQLYEFNPNQSERPQLLKGQAEDRNNTDMCWSPDGQLLYVVSGDY